MDIEQARAYALSLPGAEESLFAQDWVQYRVAVKCDPAVAIELRERYRGVEPAYHMNKCMWPIPEPRPQRLRDREMDQAFA